MDKGKRKFKKQEKREAPEFDQKIVDLARVTRVMAGGKRMKFRACVAIGNKKGQFGIGLAKGADVAIAVNKAVNKAQKNILTVPIIKETIPHEVYLKHKAAKLLLKPAPKGTGVKAGGAIRVALELAGVPNVVAKILGTNNKMNNLNCLVEAVKSFKVKPIKTKKTVASDNVKPEKEEKKLNKSNNKKPEKENKQDKKL